MFESETERLIRAAPALREIEPERIPQLLSEDFTEIVLSGVRATTEFEVARLERLRRMASIYEALTDLGTSGQGRRAAAFVAGTAHRLLSYITEARAGLVEEQILTKGAISSHASAPLLFLISGQFPDAREMARSIAGLWEGDVLRAALLESAFDLANENFGRILERARRLSRVRLPQTGDLEERATTALYATCWSGLVRLAATMLAEEAPSLRIGNFELPELAFDTVLRQAVSSLDEIDQAQDVSTYSGPRHIARLLRHLANDLPPAAFDQLTASCGDGPAAVEPMVASSRNYQASSLAQSSTGA